MSFGSGKRLQDADDIKVRIAAMDMLARRDHSRYELISKLLEKGAQRDIAETTVEQLQQEGLQSDLRYVEALLNSHVRKGRGLARIQLDLSQARVSDYLLDEVLEESGVNWVELAMDVYKKKYGAVVSDDYNERSKQMRFLQNRGFSTGEIRSALEKLKTNID